VPRIFARLSRIALTGLVVYAAIKEVFRPAAASIRPQSSLRLIIKTVAATAAAGLVLLAAGALLFDASGFYTLAADKPHFAPVRWFLETGRDRSVRFHSRGIRVPDLRNRSLFPAGFVLYRKNCQPCHGAPGVASEQIARGLNPNPPELMTATLDFSDAELYWIISHGLKMSGMPPFELQLSNEERWAIVAFVKRLIRISPADYKALAAAVDEGIDPSNWGLDDASGFARIRTANPGRGPQLLRQFGCPACHTIPAGGTGLVGPPLAGFAERQFIAGSLVNAPTNVMNWITDPKKYKPNTAMPRLNVDSRDAADIAAYLYTLGSSKRLRALQ
jgi:mono/diheme cytochrome c family protein